MSASSVENEPAPRREPAPALDRDVVPVVDDAIAADLIQHWSASAGAALLRSIRRSGALQRYIRGSRR